MRFIALLAVIAAAPVHATDSIPFDWFEYSGHDSIYAEPLPQGSFHNPILAGYYPDPSITRVGLQYFMVNSTFAHWPGIPIHESTDLVHWKLVGYALSDPAKVSFDGLSTSRGVFAPSIHFHDGMFYVINTLVDAGGNFFVTAKNPKGPWSDPVWLKEIDGIDPSFFFDDDGKSYIVNNGPPEGTPLYNGHRAIWIQEFDAAANKLIGPRKVIVNGGVDISKKPIWIEGPHLYRIDGWYYLMCAEGGTERGHSEVIFRSKSPWGPFEAGPDNPILTQRDLPATRANPVTNAGHADLIHAKDDTWWAVFLASRPYEGFRFNTGRETFLLPVSWKNGWPTILEKGKAVPTTLPGPKGMVRVDGGYDALSGNFTVRDEFASKLGDEWLQVHVPKNDWPYLKDGALWIEPGKANLSDKINAHFLARRQQHMKFDATTELRPFLTGHASAGLAAFQNENYWYFLGVRQGAHGPEVFVERHAGTDSQSYVSAIPKLPRSLKLRISGDGAHYSFYYDAGQGWKALRENDDGSILSTEVAGGFVGTVLGPFVRQE